MSFTPFKCLNIYPVLYTRLDAHTCCILGHRLLIDDCKESLDRTGTRRAKSSAKQDLSQNWIDC